MLIAPTGLVEVSSSVIYTACFRPHPCFKSKDLSKTTKFMSSPFVQSVTSSAPFRVRLSVTCVLNLPLSNLDQFYLQRLANSSSSDPVSEVPFTFFYLLDQSDHRSCRSCEYNLHTFQVTMQQSHPPLEMVLFVAYTSLMKNWVCQIVKFCSYG